MYGKVNNGKIIFPTNNGKIIFPTYNIEIEMEEETVEEFMNEIENDDESPEEIKIIKKRKPTFTKEYLDKMSELGRSPRNIEQLKKMSEIRIAKGKQKKIEKMKDELIKNGYELKEKKPTEIPPPVKEEPKIEPPQPQPPPVIATPTPAPPPPPKTETIAKPKPKTKKKPKRKVEYIDDESDEEPEYRPPQRRQSRQITQRDIEEFMRQKYASMDLNELDNRIAKQAYDFKYNQVREEIMGNQIFGRY
jgi:hypothetical protein